MITIQILGQTDLTRAIVIGTSCSGKTTFARDLAARLDAPHTELDSLHWLPGWKERDPESFRSLVGEWAARERWIIDGNYTRVRDILWPRATALIWLDYPFPLVFWRSVRRTITRAATGEEICNGNRESLRIAFSRNSIILWAIQTHKKNKRRYDGLFKSRDYSHLGKVRLKTPKAAAAFLDRAESD